MPDNYNSLSPGILKSLDRSEENMFKTKISVAAATTVSLTLLLMLLPIAQARPRVVLSQDDSVRKELEAVYAKRDQALKDKNFDFMLSQEAEDYTEKSKDGKVMNKEQADAAAEDVKKMVVAVSEESSKIESVKEGDDGEYIVEISDQGKLTIKGPDGNNHEVEGHGRSRDTWVKTEAGWKIKAHEEIESTITIDGQPVG